MTRIGLAVSTIGRPALHALLASAAASAVPPAAVVVANQSGRPLPVDPSAYPFPIEVITSSGGLSAGRNAAIHALPDAIDVVGFPNDDSVYEPGLLAGVAAVFEGASQPAAVACAYRVEDRSPLPPDGTALDRHSVWRSAEPAMFVRRRDLVAAGMFREDLGAGCSTPWQSAEGTDLLLRIMGSGGIVVSAASLTVEGPGERRDLTATQFVAKARRYARGTGFVYRAHDYPRRDLLRTVLGPWRRAARGRLELRLALARSSGRLEGILGRCVGRRQ